MLTSLHIKNYALIDDATISFTEGFTTITGETGAGKSIILGALALVLGERADSTHVRDASKKCVVEANFSLANYKLSQVFENLDFDYEPTTIIRREILPTGKSRAFVNDTPAKIQDLQELSVFLMDIHNQHETQVLGKQAFQYEVVDAFSGAISLLSIYRQEFSTFKKIQKEYRNLQRVQLEADEAYAYNLFLLTELEEAQLKPNVQEILEQQQEELSNVELLKEVFSFASQAMQQEELGILDSLQKVQSQLQKISAVNEVFAQLATRLTEAKIEIDDISFELDKQYENIEDNPSLLEEVNLQLQRIYTLQKKHQVNSVNDLLIIQEKLADAVFEKQSATEKIEKLEKQLLQQEQQCLEIASQLFEQRSGCFSTLEQKIHLILREIGMKDAVLSIQLDEVSELTERGKDEMQWLFSANKGGALQPIQKVASGGELSRIVLAVKSILASYAKLPTIIFDEIDTGVSGDVANKMGLILKEMGSGMQVISITHLPQVAAKAKHHLKVYKSVQDNKTVSMLKELNNEERILEMAAMLGGDKNSASAIAHAKSLFN